MNRPLPIKGQNIRITQEYGRKNDEYKKGYHTGLDMVSSTDKYIYNVVAGVVLRAMSAPGKGADPNGWGNYVIVRQADNRDVLYAHLDKVLISMGQNVIPGDVLGIMGRTGESTGIHLHFEVWQGNWRERNDINPAEYLGIRNEVGPISDEFAETVKLLQERSIISSPDYWLQNAIAGKTVKGEYARQLILNIGKYLIG